MAQPWMFMMMKIIISYLYLTTHNTYNKQTSMPLVGFKPTISAGERLQTHALDCAATGIGMKWKNHVKYLS
jgi:hypothetical protein